MSSTSPVNDSSLTEDTLAFNREEGKPEQDYSELPNCVRTVEDCSIFADASANGYVCKLCGYCVPTEKSIYEHTLAHFPFRCNICRFCTHSEEALRNHAENHVNLSNDVNSCCTSKSEYEEKKTDPCENEHANQCNNSATSETNDSSPPPLPPPPVALNGHTIKTESNSSSRSKVYRCRQCIFTAPTKEEFWSHQRLHIRPDKILECPKCAFVTEYKHHLEYHLRNHIGSKPFKCTKCQYACVNLSMLRSHMKSHLKQSQFRCGTCTFSSRSFSSLQVHLDKESHQAADLVAMEDMLASGIDFRSRRTTKRSNSKGSPEVYVFSSPQSNSMFSFNSSNSSAGGSSFNPFNNSSQPFALQSPAGAAAAILNSANHNTTTNMLMEIEGVKANIDAHLQCGVCDYLAPSRQAMNSHLLKHAREDSDNNSCSGSVKLPNGNSSHAATAPPVNSNGSNNSVKFEPVIPSSNVGESDSSGSGYPHTEDECRRRKRKGKAHKLIIQPHSSNEYNSSYSCIYPQTQYFPTMASSNMSKRDANVQTTSSSSNTTVNTMSSSSKLFECEQCDILFRNFAMYCTHKMFHSANDPFCCSQCGGVYPGQVDFFIHVAQEAHELR